MRHFDAPEAIDDPVLRGPGQIDPEPRARGVADAVPVDDQPYRGCTHACTYCLWGETPVLMADGRHKPIAELDVGDSIYGTVGDGVRYRRYARDDRARQVDHDQAGISGRARETGPS